MGLTTGDADAHRRFAEAFLALPAVPGTVVAQGDKDSKVRTYATEAGTYVGVAFKGYSRKSIKVQVPGVKSGALVRNLVTGDVVPATPAGDGLRFNLQCGPMELNTFLVQ